MITKFEGIPGPNLASLLGFIHSDENRVTICGEKGQPMIIRIKAITPDNQGGGTWYGVTLDIVEWLPKELGNRGQDRVDPKYLMKVYEILGESRLSEFLEDSPK